MEALTNITYRHLLLTPSLHHHRPSISSPFSSLSSRPPFSSPPFKSPRLKSSSFYLSKFLLPNLKTPKSHPFQILIPPPNPKSPKSETLILPPNPILKTTLITAVTAAAIVLAGFNLRPVLAAPPPPATVEEDRNQEDRLNSNPNPNDVESLKNLMELRIKEKKVPEAIAILEKLIQIEPEDLDWLLLRGHMHVYQENLELAELGFKEIISKDPLRVEAYHGLLMVASQYDSGLEEIEKLIKKGMELAEGEKLRDFKLLYAQVRVIEGDYNESMKIYDQLLEENSKDFRPYLCKGIIYTVLAEKDEADKCFKKYRDVVPEDHPYAKHFDEHMLATKLFLQKVDNEKKRSKT
ncbi:hypothetical protein LguiA_032220 [Lonicera macranthoides]